MKEIKLLNLEIENFRTLSKKIEFGKETEIYGLNKAGKSTVYNAFLWLLTGYDNEDLQNHKLFDTRVVQTPENALQASVSGLFMIGNDKVSIKRTADIKWITRRTSKEKKRGGSDTYHIYVDDIEYTAGEFKEYLRQNIAEERLLRIMLNGYSFLKEKWSVQRNLLIELFGSEIEDKLSDKHSDIIKTINKYLSRDKFDKDIKDKKSKAKKSIDDMDSRIKELNDQMEDVDDSLKEKIEGLKAKKISLKEEKISIQESKKDKTSIADKLAKEYAEEQAAYNEENQHKKAELREELTKLSMDFDKSFTLYNKVKMQKESAKYKLESKKQRLIQLDKERKHNALVYSELDSEQFVTEYCSQCKQPLPKDQVDTLKKEFLEDKNKRIDAILEKGKKDKDEYLAVEKEIDELSKELEIENPEPKVSQDILDLKKLINTPDIPFMDTTKGKELKAKHSEEMNKSNRLEIDGKIAEIESKIESIDNEILVNSTYFGADERNKSRLESIEKRKELKAKFVEEKMNAELLEDKAKEYDSDKAKLMQSKINEVFDYCSVVLQKQKKDGTWEDTCLIAYDGDYSVLNDGGRIIAAIDVQKAFQKLNNLILPIFVDRSESLTTPYEHDGQIVKLITTTDKGLNVKITK